MRALILENWLLLGDGFKNILSLSAQCLLRHATVYRLREEFRTVYVKADWHPKVDDRRALESRSVLHSLVFSSPQTTTEIQPTSCSARSSGEGQMEVPEPRSCHAAGCID